MFVLFVMRSYLIEVRGLKPCGRCPNCRSNKSYLIEVRGLKHASFGEPEADYCRIL